MDQQWPSDGILLASCRTRVAQHRMFMHGIPATATHGSAAEFVCGVSVTDAGFSAGS